MGGLKYRPSEHMIHKAVFTAEYSSYRTTEFKVQTSSGLAAEEGGPKR